MRFFGTKQVIGMWHNGQAQITPPCAQKRTPNGNEDTLP
jgi:hypothetical protein